MSAAIGTLPFLATLWLLVVLGARILEESGAKIAAALKGEPPLRPSREAATVRMRMPRPARPSRERTQWRAAA
jgi:hypothetical protein